MRIVFRADASPEIGTGHVMRSSAIAEEAIGRGLDCVFIGSISRIEWLEKRIQGLGFSEIINPNNFDFLQHADVLVVDSYTLDENEPLITGGKWQSVVAIVDQETLYYPHDLAIHPGLDGSWYRGSVRFLSGANYIPLRKSITRVASRSTGLIQRIVVFGGGTDTFQFSGAVADVLSKLQGFNSAIFYSQEKSRISRLDPRFSVLDFGSSLDSSLSKADLVITTASTSCLEVIARGIPVAIACAVPNQVPYYDAIGNLRLASQIGGRVSRGFWDLDSHELSTLIDDSDYRKTLIENSSGYIDLYGSKRIVDEIISLAN